MLLGGGGEVEGLKIRHASSLEDQVDATRTFLESQFLDGVPKHEVVIKGMCRNHCITVVKVNEHVAK